MPQPHTKAQIAVLWLRRDLRVADNPAMVAALQAAVTVVRCLTSVLFPHLCTSRPDVPSYPPPQQPVRLPQRGPAVHRHGRCRRLGVMQLRDELAVACLQIPVFVWAPEEEGEFQPGRCSRWWLMQSLRAFEKDLAALGSKLTYLRASESRTALIDFVSDVGAQVRRRQLNETTLRGSARGHRKRPCC